MASNAKRSSNSSKSTRKSKAAETESTTKNESRKKTAPPGFDSKLDPVIEHVLHGKPDRTYEQVIAEAGLSREQGSLLWRVLGFNDSSAAGVMFNEHDVKALKAFKRAGDRELLTIEDMYEVIRAMARTTSRLADWQISIIGDRLQDTGISSQNPDMTHAEVEGVVEQISGLRPIFERLLIQVWRRQLVDHVLRASRISEEQIEVGDTATVAFADMVGFTRIARELETVKLARLIESFEQIVTLIAAETGVKLVKTIGDEVLIMSVFPVEVAEFALRLQEFSENADDFPELRIGIATGSVISQMGDIFGETVNHASRLTAFAKPSAIYVDAETQTALETNEKYQFKSTRMRAIQGFNLMSAWELKRNLAD